MHSYSARVLERVPVFPVKTHTNQTGGDTQAAHHQIVKDMVVNGFKRMAQINACLRVENQN